jgi:radical SAM protein with 4Fe4S-binding SPASM domain
MHLFSRSFNLIKISIGFVISNLIKRPVLLGYPAFYSVEPTNRCNLQCPQCLTGMGKLGRASGDIDISTYKKIIAEIAPYSISLQLHFQGEPFLNKDIFEMINLAKKTKTYVLMSTNGHFLSEDFCNRIIESKLDKLIVSLDGLTQEDYSEYRKSGNLNLVLEGINRLTSLKKKEKANKPAIILQHLVTKKTEESLDEIKSFAKSVKAKLSLKSMQIYDTHDSSNILPLEDKYSRYYKDGSDYKIKSTLKNKCKRLWFNTVFTIDGDVVPCCFDKSANYSYGNIKKSSFKEIWLGNSANEFRARVLSARKEIPICTNCTEGLKIEKPS